MNLSPDTRLGPLLREHPGLEDDLIAFVPAMAKLKNPVLRRTIAEVATLKQISAVSGVALPELVGFLHRRLGGGGCGVSPADAAPAPIQEALPEWFDSGRVVLRIEVAEFLARGEHPLAAAQKAVAACGSGDIVELRSDFPPAPLMDIFREAGMALACVREEGVFRTCIRKP